MHEAGLVERALADALRGHPAVATLDLEINDPVGISADAALLHLEIALRELGMESVPIKVQVAGVTCGVCGLLTERATANAFCDACGYPLPRREGAPLLVRVRG